MPLIIRLLAIAVSTALATVVTKYVSDLFEEKPLEDHINDGKTTVIDLQISALEKTIDHATRLRDKLKRADV